LAIVRTSGRWRKTHLSRLLRFSGLWWWGFIECLGWRWARLPFPSGTAYHSGRTTPGNIPEATASCSSSATVHAF